MLEIYIDGDACPVKDEVYRVAGRYGLKTWVVANGWMRVPDSPLIERVTVTEGLDVADDWIVEHAGRAISSSPPTSRWPIAASSGARG